MEHYPVSWRERKEEKKREEKRREPHRRVKVSRFSLACLSVLLFLSSRPFRSDGLVCGAIEIAACIDAAWGGHRCC